MPNLPLEGCRVLVVDDDSVDAHLISSTLSRAGAEVAIAPDGPEALAVLAVRKAHVCVVDLVMPKMRGTELVAAVKAGGYRGALVGLSAHLTPEVTELWLSAGCDVVLDKGDMSRQLVRTVAAVCQSYERG